MKINKQPIQNSAIKLVAEDNGKVIGRASLFLITNDLHEEPYGLMEDVFVEEEYRGRGIGTDLVKAVIEEAKSQKCYKLIGTSRNSRFRVHAMYEEMGFKKHGLEFRIDLNSRLIKITEQLAY